VELAQMEGPWNQQTSPDIWLDVGERDTHLDGVRLDEHDALSLHHTPLLRDLRPSPNDDCGMSVYNSPRTTLASAGTSLHGMRSSTAAAPLRTGAAPVAEPTQGHFKNSYL